MWIFREFPQTFPVVCLLLEEGTQFSASLQCQKTKENMKTLVALCLAALAAVACSEDSKHTPPKVQVYSFNPGEFGKENILICHVSGFHPPDITIQLVKNGVELPGAKQTDLAFKQNWHFHLTKNVAFTPLSGEKYSCKVTHGVTTNEYAWEPNM